MVAQRRITQIIAAEGWLAVYDHGSQDVSDIRTRPLVCWALVEDAGGTHVIGMDADLVAGHKETGKFLGFCREGESLSRFQKT
jgi:hypothetical protein